MNLDNEFRVSVPIERAWEVLTDIPLITPCLPGARADGFRRRRVLRQDQDQGRSGHVQLLGNRCLRRARRGRPNTSRSSPTARIRRAPGNASATITADMTEDGDGTKVSINTDLKISGKVAQFGKGMIAEVSGKLIGQFVDCIEQQLLGDAVIDEVAAESAAHARRRGDGHGDAEDRQRAGRGARPHGTRRGLDLQTPRTGRRGRRDPDLAEAAPRAAVTSGELVRRRRPGSVCGVVRGPAPQGWRRGRVHRRRALHRRDRRGRRNVARRSLLAHSDQFRQPSEPVGHLRCGLRCRVRDRGRPSSDTPSGAADRTSHGYDDDRLAPLRRTLDGAAGDAAGVPWATLPSVVLDETTDAADDDDDADATAIPELRPSAAASDMDRPFDMLDEAELERVGQLLESAITQLPQRRSRRRRTVRSRGPISMRRSLRRAMHTGGDVVTLLHTTPRRRAEADRRAARRQRIDGELLPRGTCT